MFKRIAFWAKRQYVKTRLWPKPMKVSLGILLILLGIVNIPNPLVNGILMILLGSRLLYGAFQIKINKKTTPK